MRYNNGNPEYRYNQNFGEGMGAIIASKEIILKG